METNEEIKELEEKLDNVVVKSMSFLQRLFLILLIAAIIIGGYFLRW